MFNCTYKGVGSPCWSYAIVGTDKEHQSSWQPWTSGAFKPLSTDSHWKTRQWTTSSWCKVR